MVPLLTFYGTASTNRTSVMCMLKVRKRAFHAFDSIQAYFALWHLRFPTLLQLDFQSNISSTYAYNQIQFCDLACWLHRMEKVDHIGHFISICEHYVCVRLLSVPSIVSLWVVEAAFSVIRQFQRYVCVVCVRFVCNSTPNITHGCYFAAQAVQNRINNMMLGL